MTLIRHFDLLLLFDGRIMTTPSYRIKNLDHLGLVAGMCRELGLARMVDAILPKQGEHHVSHGEALVAMIINGLGFHSRTLHTGREHTLLMKFEQAYNL